MNNIARIQAGLAENDLDALLVFDEKNQRFAAGFPFTDGAVGRPLFCLVLQNLSC